MGVGALVIPAGNIPCGDLCVWRLAVCVVVSVTALDLMAVTEQSMVNRPVT